MKSNVIAYDSVIITAYIKIPIEKANTELIYEEASNIFKNAIVTRSATPSASAYTPNGSSE
jgi:hypothetical protein